jgi:hypothetical protein
MGGFVVGRPHWQAPMQPLRAQLGRDSAVSLCGRCHGCRDSPTIIAVAMAAAPPRSYDPSRRTAFSRLRRRSRSCLVPGTHGEGRHGR